MSKLTPVDYLKRVLPLLKKARLDFAVAGGFAASLYRDHPRMTKDVDIAVALVDQQLAQKEGESILEALGLRIGHARECDLNRAPQMNKRRSPIVMLVGRDPDDSKGAGIDLLLPRMPWVMHAVTRAQRNVLDYGFASIPTLTPEDIILAKLLALHDNPGRYLDLDDIASLLESDLDLDLLYLVERMEAFSVPLPRDLWAKAPRPLKRASKRIVAERP